MTQKKETQSEKEMTFESALARMEEIINALSRGNIGLDETTELYSEGIKLSAFCEKKLAEARQKVTLLKESGNE